MEIILIENQMSTDADDFRAIIQDTKSNSRAQIIKELAGTDSNLTETECETLLKAFFQKLAKNLE